MSANAARNPAFPTRTGAVALAALLVLTRFGHFGELSRLPDASWAVFFLVGLLLRDWRAFVAFFGLAWAVDLGALALGTPTDCFSAAYLFLVPAYGVLWFAGRAVARVLAKGQHERRHDAAVRLGPGAVVATSLALAAAVAAAFLVSNFGYWAFGPGFAPMPAGEYATRVARFFPGYLAVTFVYAFMALGVRAVASRATGVSATRPSGPGSA